MISRSHDMRSLQKKFCQKVLMANMKAHRPPVSPNDLVKDLQAKHCIRRRDMLVEVSAPPVDFFLGFNSARECKCVLESSVVVHCQGAPVSFTRWQPAGYGLEAYKHPFLAKMSFDGLPREAWNRESLNELLNSMGGCLACMTPPSDS